MVGGKWRVGERWSRVLWVAQARWMEVDDVVRRWQSRTLLLARRWPCREDGHCRGGGWWCACVDIGEEGVVAEVAGGSLAVNGRRVLQKAASMSSHSRMLELLAWGRRRGQAR